MQKNMASLGPFSQLTQGHTQAKPYQAVQSVDPKEWTCPRTLSMTTKRTGFMDPEIQYFHCHKKQTPTLSFCRTLYYSSAIMIPSAHFSSQGGYLKRMVANPHTGIPALPLLRDHHRCL